MTDATRIEVEGLKATFGEYLRQVREDARLTQTMLAHASGISRAYVSFLERGHKSPTLEVFYSLCETLDVRPADFLEEVSRRLHQRYEEAEQHE